jgi:threonyl-tRNA synthetase
VQAVVLPITEKHHDYARKVVASLRERGLRVKVDLRSEKVGYKIREGQLQKIPYMLVVGDKEVEAASVAVRNRKKGDLGPSSVSEIASKIERIARERSLEE